MAKKGLPPFGLKFKGPKVPKITHKKPKIPHIGPSANFFKKLGH